MKPCKLLQRVLIVLYVFSFVTLSSAQADPYFAIDQNEWAQALADGNVRAMTEYEWLEYLSAWQDPCQGYPYPWTKFFPPQLYVYQPPSCEPSCCWPDFDGSGIVNFRDFAYFATYWLAEYYPYPKAPGMVMAWNPPQIDGNTSASAWVFDYGYDPDLTNTTVEIDVDPSPGITIVSFGFKDISGNKQAWWWDCGAGKPVDGRTKLTITTDGAGVSTATPQTSNHLLQAGFAITQVKYFMADEQDTWRNDRAVSPPGQTVAKAWNYWYNLVVTPLPVPPPPVYFKWRQPARYINNRGNYWGWDEVSVDRNRPLLADDWVCTDNRPVTDIHWWGSFLNKEPNKPGWLNPGVPASIRPVGFHIGIWTDQPGDLQDMNKISHPKQMIWEYRCYDYNCSFVGYDRDPNNPTLMKIKDSCFEFSCNVNPPFVQDPNSNCVYWLSIAAMYQEPNVPLPPFIWGWKTRPHYSKDDAVRITSTKFGEWPPMVGSQWGNGIQLECPQWCSWDLAFELTTNKDVNCP